MSMRQVIGGVDLLHLFLADNARAQVPVSDARTEDLLAGTAMPILGGGRSGPSTTRHNSTACGMCAIFLL
jgi:hypothetical protein